MRRRNMPELNVEIRLSDDREIAKITFAVDGRIAEPASLDLNQLSNLIAVLGEVRTRMLEGRRQMGLEGRNVRTVSHPNWYIQVAQIEGSLLAFDHPGFGPIGFAIPKSEVAEMVRILNTHLTMPSSPSGSHS
jgi:hypothetical protein